MTDSPAVERPSPRQVALGLFVLGQLGFLVLSNGLGFYQEPQPHLPSEVAPAVDRVLPGYGNKSGQAWTLPDELATLMRRWSQLTGQDQRWSLFAPGVYKVTGFPAVVLVGETDPTVPPAAALAHTFDLMNRRPDPQVANGLQTLHAADLQPAAMRAAGQVVAPLSALAPLQAATVLTAINEPRVTAPPLDVDVFLSDNEPADRRHFMRLGKFRMRRFEGYMIPFLSQRDKETLDEARGRWAESIREHVSKNADGIHTYLQWRLAAYRQRHPGRPAVKQVILIERIFAIAPPDHAGDCWQGPRTLPIARWQPDAERPKDYRPIERYSPVTARFENVPK
jgi:hypothetical protein